MLSRMLFRGSVQDLQQRLAAEQYVADHGLAVSIFLAMRLGRPLFLEGEAGVGKTALASAVAAVVGADLIRLQCYEGLDISHAVYEWDYARQLVELRILEAAGRVRAGSMAWSSGRLMRNASLYSSRRAPSRLSAPAASRMRNSTSWRA